MITLYGWLLLILIVSLNQFAVAALVKHSLVAGILLSIGVPVFTGYALAQIGVRLLGSPS